MKKLLVIAVAVLMLVGCGNGEKTTGEKGSEATTTEESDNTPVTFSQADFALYTLPDNEGKGDVVMGLGMAEDNIQINNEKMIPYIIATQYDVVTENVAIDDEMVESPHNVINHILYTGGNLPVETDKNIVSTGVDGVNDSKCSKAEDVIKKYGIDTNTEEYIQNKRDDKNYVIQLYFGRKLKQSESNEATTATQPTTQEEAVPQQKEYDYTRLITKKGQALIQPDDAAYSIKLIISEGYVKGIDLYSFVDIEAE